MALSHDTTVTIIHRSTADSATSPHTTHPAVTEDIGGFGHALSFAGDGIRLAVSSAVGVVDKINPFIPQRQSHVSSVTLSRDGDSKRDLPSRES